MLIVALANAGLAICYGLFITIASPDLFHVANTAGPIILLVTCLWGAQKNLKASPLALFTPIPWFLIACAAYFGFGPLVYHFGSAESVSYCDTFFAVDEATLLKVNLLNVVGIAFVITGFSINKLFTTKRLPLRVRKFNQKKLLTLVLLFVVTGLAVKFSLAIPYYLGLISWTLPGSIQYMATFSRVAIIILFVFIRHGVTRYKWLLYGLVGEELLTALMSLSKLAVIEVFFSIALGWYLSSRPSLRKLALSGALIVLVYALILSPFVSYARLFTGSVGVGAVSDLGESAAGFSNTARRDDFADIMPGVQAWWTRLSYSNAQAFAMYDYDNDKGGESLELIAYTFMPRIIFPDKPVMTPGRDFTAKVTGEIGETATSAGIFAEAYWNGGWLMVAAVCLFVGLLLFWFGKFSENIIASGSYEYLPIVMIGINMGFSPADWLVAVYFGPLINAIVLYILIRLLVSPFIRVTLKRNEHYV